MLLSLYGTRIHFMNIQSFSQQQLVVAWFKQQLDNKELCEKLKKIKLVVTDVDGCLTPSNIMLMDGGDEGKDFCIQDGYGIDQCLKHNLLQIAFLTGRNSASTAARAKRLGIVPELCVMGVVEEKKDSVIQMQERLSIRKEETLFFGDDAQDYKTYSVISLFASPANAVFYVYAGADIQLPLIGGHGAMRLLIDLILFVQQKHFAQSLLTQALI